MHWRSKQCAPACFGRCKQPNCWIWLTGRNKKQKTKKNWQLVRTFLKIDCEIWFLCYSNWNFECCLYIEIIYTKDKLWYQTKKLHTCFATCTTFKSSKKILPFFSSILQPRQHRVFLDCLKSLGNFPSELLF